MRDILCVPQDLRQRGVAVIRPGKGRKLAGLGERGKHTWDGGSSGSNSAGRSEGGYSLQGRQREAEEEGLRGEWWGWGGDKPAWELGESPSSGPPGGLSASRVGVRKEPQEVWEASPLLGRWFQVSLLVPSSLVGPHCISRGRLCHPSNAQACPRSQSSPAALPSLRPCLEVKSVACGSQDWTSG